MKAAPPRVMMWPLPPVAPRPGCSVRNNPLHQSPPPPPTSLPVPLLDPHITSPRTSTSCSYLLFVLTMAVCAGAGTTMLELHPKISLTGSPSVSDVIETLLSEVSSSCLFLDLNSTRSRCRLTCAHAQACFEGQQVDPLSARQLEDIKSCLLSRVCRARNYCELNK